MKQFLVIAHYNESNKQDIFGIFYSFEDAYKFAKKEAEKVFLTMDQSDNMIIKHKDKIEIDEYGYWEIKENNHGYL